MLGVGWGGGNATDREQEERWKDREEPVESREKPSLILE